MSKEARLFHWEIAFLALATRLGWLSLTEVFTDCCGEEAFTLIMFWLGGAAVPELGSAGFVGAPLHAPFRRRVHLFAILQLSQALLFVVVMKIQTIIEV